MDNSAHWEFNLIAGTDIIANACFLSLISILAVFFGGGFEIIHPEFGRLRNFSIRTRTLDLRSWSRRRDSGGGFAMEGFFGVPYRLGIPEPTCWPSVQERLCTMRGKLAALFTSEALPVNRSQL